jgi:hypothetical protein
MLEDLREIGKGREFQPINVPVVSKLTALGNEILKKYEGIHIMPKLSELDKHQDDIYTDVVTEAPAFDEKDLADYILAQCNHELNLDSSQTLGMYTGCLLELLTWINRSEGIKAHLHVNGRGNRFPYLFYMTRNADDVIVENFSGNGICEDINEVGTLALIRNTGNHMAYEIKKAGNVVLKDNTGDFLCSRIENAEQIYSINDRSQDLLHEAGRNGNVKFSTIIMPYFDTGHLYSVSGFIDRFLFFGESCKDWKYSVMEYARGGLSSQHFEKENPLVDKLRLAENTEKILGIGKELRILYGMT